MAHTEHSPGHPFLFPLNSTAAASGHFIKLSAFSRHSQGDATLGIDFRNLALAALWAKLDMPVVQATEHGCMIETPSLVPISVPSPAGTPPPGTTFSNP